MPADSPSAKLAFAKYNAYLERKAQKKREAEEEERRRKQADKEAAEERENLFANLEPGMYLAVRHYAGIGLGHVYVVGRVHHVEYKKRKNAANEERVIYVAKYFGWLLTEKQAEAVISGKKPLYKVVKT